MYLRTPKDLLFSFILNRIKKTTKIKEKDPLYPTKGREKAGITTKNSHPYGYIEGQ